VPSGSLYEILSVAPDASAEEVRAAFHRASKEVHPDTGGSDELFCRVKDAYDVLSDPGRRAEYDRSLNAPVARPGGPAQVEASGATGGSRTVSLALQGSIDYTNNATVTSGSVKVEPSTGPVISVTGTVTIPGAAGGTATIAVAIARVLGVSVGLVTVSDPGAGVETGAVVLNGTLRRTAGGQVTGTASGLRGLSPYTMHFTI
jgi:DnaJ-class molecular chaperone